MWVKWLRLRLHFVLRRGLHLTQTSQKTRRTGINVVLWTLLAFLFLSAVCSWAAFSGRAESTSMESVAGEWPMFHHDLMHTGSSDSPHNSDIIHIQFTDGTECRGWDGFEYMDTVE